MDPSPTRQQYGSKKRVKIHPNTVTVKYATHFPQPGDEGYDDAPSFEDFGSFMDNNPSKRLVSESGQGRTLFGTMDSHPKADQRDKGVGGQLASFGEASVLASRVTWGALFGAAIAHGCVALITRLAADPLQSAIIRAHLHPLGDPNVVYTGGPLLQRSSLRAQGLSVAFVLLRGLQRHLHHVCIHVLHHRSGPATAPSCGGPPPRFLAPFWLSCS